ncbi:5-oxoprolinase subunit PxpA [Microbacterium aquimaris]|uniref:5-oxoprolinase subunit PxpA n=1 Tax=Microbacterium aquimaris TaxID=459816 RepID=UPI002AD36281|nr:5-oxoprolinase subunit PxpA [Microbacterium aquimaris]MDZ8274992.1 5-oxoprolinase subunit PxpA [Microbacterium aquimaris]
MAAIDLNADLGETVDGVPTADDDAMFAVVSSASVACGGHAGDEASMRASVVRAARHGVAVGAHPSYPDAAGFGRTSSTMSGRELRATLDAQLAALAEAGGAIRYVKPHGALYHAVTADEATARVVASAVRALSDDIGGDLPLLGLGGVGERCARDVGLPFVREAFLDRGYLPDGSLVPRREPGALLDDPDRVARRAVRLATDGRVETVEGTVIVADAASLCVHGDSPAAVAMARAVRAALDAAGIEVRAPW